MTPSISLGERQVGVDHNVYVIAEVGSNHNGDLDTALRLIEVCAQAGVDAVKFQAFSRDGLFNPSLPAHESEHGRRDRELLERRWALLPQFTVPGWWWPELAECASTQGVDFACTPFSLEAVSQIAAMGPPFIKIASGDITWHELIVEAAMTGIPLVVSTGASDLREVEQAVLAAERGGVAQLALLHCVSSYPPAWHEAQLGAIATLRSRFRVPVGLSDHSPGSTIPIAATALGACIVEKHVTLSRSQEGLDHHFALEPDELAQLVIDLNHAHQALGDGRKSWAPSEDIERFWVRRGLYLAIPARAGATVTRDLLRVVRPRLGIGAENLGSIIGRQLRRDMASDEPLREEDLV